MNGYIYIFEYRTPFLTTRSSYGVNVGVRTVVYVSIRYYNPTTQTWSKTSIKSANINGHDQVTASDFIHVGITPGALEQYVGDATIFSHMATDGTWLNERTDVYNFLTMRYTNNTMSSDVLEWS